MIPFTAIDSTTQAVLYSGQADDPLALESPGVSIVVGIRAPDGSYRSGDTWIQKPERPSLKHVWNWPSKSWLDPRSLTELKAEKMAEIKDSRDTQLATFSWDGSVFDWQRSEGKVNLLGLSLRALSQGYVPEHWRLADNSWRTLSAQDALAVYEAGIANMRQAFQTFAALESQVNAPQTTAESLAQIAWPG